MTAPILLFTYNRLWHTEQTIKSLQANLLAEDSELFIFSDGAKNEANRLKVKEVRDYLKSIQGFKSVEVIEREKNFGLANSIISAVTEMIAKYDKVIVLEDDMVSSPYFLNFMNDGLEMYQLEPSVACIHGYRYPIGKVESPFFVRGADCWGWATWKRAWNNFNEDGAVLLAQLKSQNLIEEFNVSGNYPYSKMLEDQIAGKIDSWAIRWKASAFLQNQFTLYYKESLIQNIGNDNSGTHSHKTDSFSVGLANNYIGISKLKVEEDSSTKLKLQQFYNKLKPSLLERIRAKCLSMLK